MEVDAYFRGTGKGKEGKGSKGTIKGYENYGQGKRVDLESTKLRVQPGQSKKDGTKERMIPKEKDKEQQKAQGRFP